LSIQQTKFRRPVRLAFRASAILLSVLGIADVTSACLTDDVKPKMVWHRGELGDPGSLDPHKATTVVESNILDELFEGLVTLNARGEIIPGAAESWTVDPSSTVYQFTLRPGAKWSNGDELAGGDFVYAFRRLMSPSTGAPYASILYTKNAEKTNRRELPVAALGVRALDKRTLEITLKSQSPISSRSLPT
jgi:oligopeptide transport system substrate-binding protein